jgi:energy-coupling factor transporter ATP-binding protein EcfA2
MKLKSFSHTRLEPQAVQWGISNLVFSDLNLIVGRNAVGKSRTIGSLANLIKMILQQQQPDAIDSSWQIELSDDKTSLSYHVRVSQNRILEERICYQGEDVLVRKGDTTRIKAVSDSFKEIHPPADKLALQVRRDTIEYPYFEDIITWATNTYGLKFGKITGWNSDKDQYAFNLFPTPESIPNMFDSLDEEGRVNILSSLKKLGYNIHQISARRIDVVPANTSARLLEINEEGIPRQLLEMELSQGMLRSLYLLIFIEYIANAKTPRLLVIDDLCEGLDYQRAVVLGQTVFEVCKDKNIQLIATSNDGFLMDVVKLDYWNVLQRKGSTVVGINKANAPKVFEDFKFTGLTNFDFFSSDYLNQGCNP